MKLLFFLFIFFSTTSYAGEKLPKAQNQPSD